MLVVLVLVAGALGVLADARFVTADALSIRSVVQPDATLQLRDAERAVQLNPWISFYRDTAADLQVQAFMAQRDAYLASGNDPTALAAASASYEKALTALEETLAYTPTELDHYSKLASLYLYATSIDPPEPCPGHRHGTAGPARGTEQCELALLGRRRLRHPRGLRQRGAHGS